MNDRENILSLFKRQGYERVPFDFGLCPSLEEEYRKNTGSDLYYGDYFNFPFKGIPGIGGQYAPEKFVSWYKDMGLKEGTYIDDWGVAHEPGSKEAFHMTRMRHPLQGIDDLELIKSYPFPDYSKGESHWQKPSADEIHKEGKAACGFAECTIWETAWYVRSMEDLMVDMMTESPIAEFILDKVTEQVVIKTEAFAKAGADILFTGDDIGTQKTAMMSLPLYQTWIKPRFKKVIDAARAINPDILIHYHSCGYALPFFDDLIEVGVDIINPLQSESMDVFEVLREYGDRVSFHGAIGTQTIMPFGTPDEIKKMVWKILDAAGSKGGILPSPTHVLEPEVPWENVVAYMEACKSYK